MLKTYSKHYIGINLLTFNHFYCPGPAVVNNRICACPGETYFNGIDYPSSPTRAKCLCFPDIFDRSHLKTDITYTHDGKEYVQHHGLVTYAECTSEYVDILSMYIHGYMT